MLVSSNKVDSATRHYVVQQIDDDISQKSSLDKMGPVWKTPFKTI